jgi:hypothetical protein
MTHHQRLVVHNLALTLVAIKPRQMMKTFVAITLAFSTVAISANAGAGEASSQSTTNQVDAAVKTLADAQARVLSKAVTFCVANHQPESRSLDGSVKSYVEAFSTGTKAGMIEIAKTDKDILRSAPAYQGKDFEMMDRQGESLLKKVQASPATECMKLGAFLASGTTATFKESTLQGHREYKAKRAEYCARLPKPNNCD